MARRRSTSSSTAGPTGFGDYTGFPPSIPCYAVFVTATMYQHNISDSFSSGARQVCLPAA